MSASSIIKVTFEKKYDFAQPQCKIRNLMAVSNSYCGIREGNIWEKVTCIENSGA